MIVLDDRQKRLARLIGYPLLALVTFVLGVHFTFPYGRVKALITERLSAEYDVKVKKVSPGWFPGHYSIKELSLSTRPASEAEAPKTLTIDRIDLNVGLLALIGKKVSVDVDARLGEGRVTGHVESSTKGVSLDLETEDLPLESIPGVAFVTGGAPIKGGLVARFKVNLPKGKWVNADGRIDVSCSSCTIGDGATKVKPVATGQVNAFNSEGFTLPRIKLGQITGKLQITNGAACIEVFQTKSSHGELSVDGGLKLADPFALSQTNLFARLKLTEEFRKESPRNQDFDILISAGAKQADGWSAYVARSQVNQLRWLAARNPPVQMKECQGIGRDVAKLMPTTPPGSQAAFVAGSAPPGAAPVPPPPPGAVPADGGPPGAPERAAAEGRPLEPPPAPSMPVTDLANTGTPTVNPPPPPPPPGAEGSGAPTPTAQPIEGSGQGSPVAPVPQSSTQSLPSIP